MRIIDIYEDIDSLMRSCVLHYYKGTTMYKVAEVPVRKRQNGIKNDLKIHNLILMFLSDEDNDFSHVIGLHNTCQVCLLVCLVPVV